MKKLKFLNLLLIFVLICSLFATVAVAKDDSLDKIVKSGKVKVGFCVDVPPIIADMSRTLERAKKVNFTQPWMVTGTYIVVRNDSEWKSWKDMNKKGVELGCILGTIGEQNIKSVLPKATPTIYNSNVEQKLALEQERIEGLANDLLLASRSVAKSEGLLRLLPDPLEADALGFTLSADDYHFLIWMNLWIEHLKATGEYDELMNYWIYTDEWEKDYPGY